MSVFGRRQQPTNSEQRYKAFIRGVHGHDSTLVNAMSECDAFGLSPANAAAEVMRVIEVVNDWKTHFSAQGVSEPDIHSLAQQIDGDYLLAQRTGFAPEQFVRPAGKRPRQSPFR